MNNLIQDTERDRQAPEALSVSQLSKKIHDTLDSRIGRVDVVGQMNNPRLGNHWYFTLADGDSTVDCAMWAPRVAANNFQGWEPTQGDQVVVRGTVGHYAKYGKTQIYVQKMKLVGEEKGKLQREFDTLVKELREAGWFDESHKKMLPKYPRRIAVITSATSAAVQDVKETARQRWSAIPLLIVNVPVQGDAAVPAIIEALHRIDKAASSLQIDAIIITRGGGSLEELWSFNDRGVVEAAFHCTTPIVAAIGHESDTSIIELVADHRASTPTQAAMVLVPEKEELHQMINHFAVRLASVLQRSIEQRCSTIVHKVKNLRSVVATQVHAHTMRISSLVETLASKRPHNLVQARQKRSLTLESNVKTAIFRFVTVRKHRIATLESRLQAIGPMEVLRRGFSLTQDSSGALVRSVQEVAEGDQIKTVLADGTIESTVECTS